MYGKLIKVFFKENFSLKRLLGTDPKKHKVKTILLMLTLLYAIVSFLGVFGFMFFDLGKTLNQYGLINVMLIYAFIYSSVLAVMFVLFRANGYLFNYKDYELLEPLPIKTHTVVLAKTTVMLVFIYLSVLAFLAPISFSYFYHAGFDTVTFIIFVVAALTIPLIPTIVFSFLSLLVTRITAGMRNTNLLSIILLFLFFFGIMYLAMSVNSFGDANPLLNQQAFMERIGSAYPPIKWFVGAIQDQNFAYLAFLVASNFGLFALFIFSVQKLVVSTNQRAMAKITRKHTKAAISKQRSLMASISVKEFKKFINTPIYALNLGIGPLMLLILSVASIFYADTINSYFNTEFNIGVTADILILIIIAFCISMVFSSAVSLSLEGKNFWILRSMPIAPKTVMYGKLLFNVYLGLPLALISLIIFKFTFNIEPITFIIMAFFTISLSLMVSAFGSIINLFLPKFEYRNPAEVVKQSAAALLGLFGTWAILVIDGFIFYFAVKGLSKDIAILMMSLFNWLLFGVMMLFIERKTESLFIKFEV